MAYQTSPREFCRIRSYPSESELSTGQHNGSTSECSSSTCDTTGSQRYESNGRLVGPRISPLHSLKRAPRQRSVQQYADSAPIICPNCDAMRMQLTEATTQCYDQWIKRIKVLEEMLQEKQNILDELQGAWYERCQLLEEEQRITTELKKEASIYIQTISDLKAENYQLRDTVGQKEELIEELCDEVKLLRDKDLHNQKLRQMDLGTIKKLRQSAEGANKCQYRKKSKGVTPRRKSTVGTSASIKKLWNRKLRKQRKSK
ncbi:two-component system sensor kinase, putative [Babesia ovis]|uniref:Two-component system sensor kinase, putative n=1 Tax=Babesia ovis TaxID=5869 RepID=A0A9W5T8E9_BABOV|nr:two-component system sensor kinase, putative [Babesia ovis]